NGPDGNLYVVDMYRGVIQHETFLTDYLKEQILDRGLEKPLGMGRIYRIVYEGDQKKPLTENSESNNKAGLEAGGGELSGEKLVSWLSHPNGWWRDYAQQLLVEKNDPSVVPELMKILEGAKSHNYNQIHALWVLEGMVSVSLEAVNFALKSESPQVRATAIRIGERFSKSEHASEILSLYNSLVTSRNPVVDLHLALRLV